MDERYVQLSEGTPDTSRNMISHDSKKRKENQKCTKKPASKEERVETIENPQNQGPRVYYFLKKKAKRGGYKAKKARALTRTTLPQATSQQIIALQDANKINKLPGETLLDVVNIRPSLSLPADLAHVVAQATVAAYQHAHSADLVFDLYTDECVDIWPAREHLHRRRRALYLLGVAWAGYEEHDAKDFASAVHS